jgi:hypothetical protein
MVVYVIGIVDFAKVNHMDVQILVLCGFAWSSLQIGVCLVFMVDGLRLLIPGEGPHLRQKGHLV